MRGCAPWNGFSCVLRGHSRITLTNRKSESHGTVRRLLEIASAWRVRVAPPELMWIIKDRVEWKQTSQILEQIGTGAEARATSGNSAICGTCAGKKIECGKT